MVVISRLFIGACMLVAFAAQTAFAREERAQSQSEMNMEAADSFRRADATLNKVYQKVMAALDEEAKGKLKAAQRAWVAFRDAQAQFEADEARGGSMAPLLYEGARATLTNLRIKELQRILKQRAE